ncbi:MAG: DUF58 domain-containing protein [Lentisphaeria bacterium]|nr:DUF58 domain-containing protein [Lentisphaeria bacterium]
MITKDLIANVRRLEIRTRRIVDDLTAGAYHSVFKGRGMEFDEVREYAPGDDIRAIDWNVTARMGHPFIKRFVEERELTVMLLVDVSASGDFGSTDKRKRETATELAALLAFSAIRNDDQVGLLLFSDLEELFVKPRKGKKHALRLIRELMACQRQREKTNIGRALESMMRTIKRRAVVFIISDMLDDGFEQGLRAANKRHDVIILRITDPIELSLPNVGCVALADAESGERRLFNSRSNRRRRAVRLEAADWRLKQEKMFRETQTDLIDLRCGEDPIIPLMRFFRKREKRR